MDGVLTVGVKKSCFPERDPKLLVRLDLTTSVLPAHAAEA